MQTGVAPSSPVVGDHPLQCADVHPSLVVEGHPAECVRAEPEELHRSRDAGVHLTRGVHQRPILASRHALCAASRQLTLPHGGEGHEVRRGAAAHEQPARLRCVAHELRQPAKHGELEVGRDLRAPRAVAVHRGGQQVRGHAHGAGGATHEAPPARVADPERVRDDVGTDVGQDAVRRFPLYRQWRVAEPVRYVIGRSSECGALRQVTQVVHRHAAHPFDGACELVGREIRFAP